MTTTLNNGRLGNQIIRNIAVSLLAERHNLHVIYFNHPIIQILGIPLHVGTKKHKRSMVLNDANYMSVYHSERIQSNLKPNDAFFQTNEIIQLIYQYLHRNTVQTHIIEQNPFRERYQRNKDVFIHIRLTDVAHFNPGIQYYRHAIQSVEYENMYVSTDEPDHKIIKELCEWYPSLQIIQYGEIKTIQFASTCKHVILSHGSFSAIIGYLSFFSTVHYPKYDPEKMWYGDIFSIDQWISH
jgi:hypothetical protein